MEVPLSVGQAYVVDLLCNACTTAKSAHTTAQPAFVESLQQVANCMTINVITDLNGLKRALRMLEDMMAHVKYGG